MTDLPQALSNQAILAMCGPETFARALPLVREGHVGRVTMNADRTALLARVTGSHRASYSTSVDLADTAVNSSPVHRGRCTCPVALDCKHAAAVLLAARLTPEVLVSFIESSWEQVLRAVLDQPEQVAPTEPLAIEFDLTEIPGYGAKAPIRSLRMRPLQRGSKGRWVRQGITWDDLEHRGGSYLRDHHALVLQLRALVSGGSRYFFARSQWMELDDVAPGFWSALTRAMQAGVELLYEGRPVVLPIDAVSASLDLRRGDDGAVEIAADLRTADDVVSTGTFGLLGEPAHGAFWLAGPVDGAGPESARQLTLAPLSSVLDEELAELVEQRRRLTVPAADQERLLSDYVPRLARRTAVLSSDRSVELPRPWELRLRCTAAFRPGHLVRLDWSALYASGSRREEYALDDPVAASPIRDPQAERSLASGLRLPYDRIPGLLAAGGAPRGRGAGGGAFGAGPAAHALFAQRDAVLIATEVLPRLAEQGVEVVVEGEVVDYREAAEEPTIEVSTQPADGGSDWFDLRVKVTVDGEVLDFEQLFVALSLGDEVLITDSGVCVPLDRPQLTALRDLISEARGLREPEPGEESGQRISTAQASLWGDLVQLGVVVEQSTEWSEAVRGLLDAEGVDPVDPPAGLTATLRPYQLDGYRWLAFLDRHRLGGILADDMGLGKTLQTLASIVRAREVAPDEPPFLVVAPTSVVGNWVGEAARFAPGLRVVTLGETSARRRTPLAETVAGADLVITSYAVLRLDADELATVSWRGFVLDEAQFVKNRSAKTYLAARRIQAPFRLTITGTPVENSLMDLWSLLSLSAPGLFPHPERFSQLYRLPIERSGDPEALARLRRRIRPLMLRRTKEAVAADLPPKQEQVLQVVLQPKHQRVYQTQLQRERQKVLGLVDDLDKNRFTILRSLTLLRRLALDPSLVDPAHVGVPASKLDVLVEHLDELVGEGHRALVFSQFVGVLDRVRERLEGRIPYAYLDGATADRGAAIDTFTSGGAPVFLISLKAGGFGLNLTEADYCFVLDPWWNPAAEAQAVDRAHRIGQTRTVMVYRLVAKGTIEEKVMELKARKEVLVDAVLGGDVLADAALTAEDIRSLLGS